MNDQFDDWFSQAWARAVLAMAPERPSPGTCRHLRESLRESVRTREEGVRRELEALRALARDAGQLGTVLAGADTVPDRRMEGATDVGVVSLDDVEMAQGFLHAHAQALDEAHWALEAGPREGEA